MYTNEVGKNTGDIYKKYASKTAELPKEGITQEETVQEEIPKEETINFDDLKDEFIHEEEPSFKPPKNYKILVQNEKFTIGCSYNVRFDGAMRNAQINCAKDGARIGRVMSTLSSDLRRVRDGYRKGGCDISEVRRVEAAIRRARMKKNQVSK